MSGLLRPDGNDQFGIMKSLVCLILLIAALLFSNGPLPKFNLPTIPKISLSNVRRKKSVITFEEQIGFLYAIKALVLSGATNHQAVDVALSTLHPDYLLSTRIAITNGDELIEPLRLDSENFNFSALTDLSLTLQVSDKSGAPISSALSRLIHNLVATRTSKQLIAAELASTKATILVLAALPAIGFLLASVLGAEPMGWLLHTTVGRTFLILGIVLELLGLAWVNRITSRAMLGSTRGKQKSIEVSSQSIVCVLENLSLCLAAGMNIPNAIAEIAEHLPHEIGSDLAVLTSRFRLGDPMNRVLTDLGFAKPRWRPITDALVGALISGGPIQSHLEDLLSSYRITAEMENLKRIRSIAVRAVAPLGLCFLPAFMMLSIAPMVVGLFKTTIW